MHMYLHPCRTQRTVQPLLLWDCTAYFMKHSPSLPWSLTNSLGLVICEPRILPIFTSLPMGLQVSITTSDSIFFFHEFSGEET